MGLESIVNKFVGQIAENNDAPKIIQTPKAEIATQTESDAGAASKLGELQNQASQLRFNTVNRSTDPPPPPKDFTKEATVTKVGDQTIIDAGAGDDKIGVTQNAKTGAITINVNGASKTFSKADSANLVIKAGEGNDTIKVGKGVIVQLTLEGGNGNDIITVDKGIKARQYINGGAGNDTLTGGAGNDVIYGGNDNDTIDGGAGNDYLEGGKGGDKISGGSGNDVLSGGIGDDTLRGGTGSDVLYAGQGKDKLYGEQGSNKIFSQKDDEIEKGGKGIKNVVVTVDLTIQPGTSVVVKGSNEFKERVEADIEMLRSSESGRQMLTAFDNSKKTVTIEEFNGANGGADSVNKVHGGLDPKTRKAGKADDASIGYNPQFMPGDSVEPMTVFYHEMSHAYNIMTGTLQPGYYKGNGTKTPPALGNDNPTKDAKGNIIEDRNYSIPNRERQAVGLDNDGVKYDFDNNSSTPETTANPESLTENGLRKEMNRPKRPAYRSF